MGNQKLKWTAEEEEGLKAGVAKYGVGKWKNILGDSEFKHKLANRSNVDLKDKWRNMCCNVGQVCGAYVMTPEEKATATGALPPNTQNISSAPVSKDDTKEKPPKSSERVKSGPKYNEMILEALSSFKDHNGSDFGSIVGFIEKKYEVSYFRRLLSSKLRKLIMQGEIEKVQKRYKIKHASLGTKTPSPKQKTARPKPLQESRLSFSTKIVEDAAETAAHKISQAKYKSYIAAEAVEASERVSQLAEDANALVAQSKKILDQWEEEEADSRSSKNKHFNSFLALCTTNLAK